MKFPLSCLDNGDVMVWDLEATQMQLSFLNFATGLSLYVRHTLGKSMKSL